MMMNAHYTKLSGIHQGALHTCFLQMTEMRVIITGGGSLRQLEDLHCSKSKGAVLRTSANLFAAYKYIMFGNTHSSLPI